MSALRHGSLAGQDLLLLNAGASVLLNRWNELVPFHSVTNRAELSVWMKDGLFDAPDRLSYIGERDADGWIHAPEGGWTSNPVPGVRVDLRQNGYSGIGESYLSDNQDWTDRLDAGRIIAFRPATAEPNQIAPSVSSSHPCYGEHQPGCDCVFPEQTVSPTPSYLARLSAPSLQAQPVAQDKGASLRDTQPGAERAVLAGDDRNLVEVDLENGMQVSIVREDDYDAVTLWSEDRDSIITMASVPHLANVGLLYPASQSPLPVSTADGFTSAPGVRVDEDPQSLDQIVSGLATVLARPAYSLSEAVAGIETAHSAIAKGGAA